jgi:dTDP-glucose pyrophosphorylase
MWGVIPAAGVGSRIQPLAFSKELLPVGARMEEGTERPRAVCEYLVDRMLVAGVNKICFVISPGKSDIVEYFGARVSSRAGAADLCYVIQPAAGGLCDALFRAIPLIGADEEVVIGLPDTIWFPEDGLRALPAGVLAFLLFPVDRPELFDAVIAEGEEVKEIQVKQAGAGSNWVWGAFRMPGRVFQELYKLWREPERGDEYIGTLVNAYLGNGGRALGVRAGEAYVDVGTLHGYRNAIQLLAGRPASGEGWVIDAKRRGDDLNTKTRRHEGPRRELEGIEKGRVV